MREILQSPILHFILVGIFLFFLYEQLKPQNREVINITSQTIDALVQQQAELQQLPVSEEQREQLVRSHIEDEVLLKVAYDQGLDKNDFRVRKRILSLVRSSLTEVVPEPTYSQMQAYYKENQEEYLSDTSWSFQQVFFNINSDRLPNDPEGFVTELGQLESTEGLGDFSTAGGPRKKISFNQLAGSYGKQFAEAVNNAPPGSWTGPIESMMGIHYVLVYEKHNPELPSFEQMESYLRQDYIFRKTRDLQKDKILELAKEFDIVVEGESIEL